MKRRHYDLKYVIIVIEREIRGSLEEETQVDHEVFFIGEQVCYQNSIDDMGDLFFIWNLKC